MLRTLSTIGATLLAMLVAGCGADPLKAIDVKVKAFRCTRYDFENLDKALKPVVAKMTAGSYVYLSESAYFTLVELNKKIASECGKNQAAVLSRCVIRTTAGFSSVGFGLFHGDRKLTGPLASFGVDIFHRITSAPPNRGGTVPPATHEYWMDWKSPELMHATLGCFLHGIRD